MGGFAGETRREYEEEERSFSEAYQNGCSHEAFSSFFLRRPG